MTKEEYGNFALRYKGCGACFPMYHTLSRAEKMWFTAIQKDVAELEDKLANVDYQLEGRDLEIKDLEKKVGKLEFALENKTVDYDKLEKENAELKADFIKSCKVKEQGFREAEQALERKNDQLTKAKEIIKRFSEFVNNDIEYDPEHPQEHTDLWNDLCKEAEQFINSEVEK